MLFSVWLAGAFVAGLTVRQLGLPPLVGFLGAGFVFSALGFEPNELLDELSEIGVLVLLFSVGLKVRLITLIRPEVLATGAGHLLILGGLATLALLSWFPLDTLSAITLAASLGFSSTVLAAKLLEYRRELRSFHGRVAIGILILQDLVAVGLLATLGGHSPSPWALALPVLLLLLRPLLKRALDWIGHNEMLIVYGAVLALAVGGYGFELVGLSPELGALVMGTLLADHPKSKELGDVLWSIKEFLLVGFFLAIGMSALPTPGMLLIALGLTLLLPVKAMLFQALLMFFGLRARTAFLSALSLASFSEFGLIVVEFGVENGVLSADYLIVAALAVSISFAIAAPLNRHAHRLYELLGRGLERFETSRRHPDDQPLSLGSAEVLVVGMGRIGTGAYDYLHDQGFAVAAIENDPGKIQKHRSAGRRVVFADAEDPGFWHRLKLERVRAVLLAMPDLEGKVLATEQLRMRGFDGLISACHEYEDQREKILSAGADTTFNNYAQAGLGFATHTCESLNLPAGASHSDAA